MGINSTDTHPAGDFSGAMDQNSQNLPIGEALFLCSERPATFSAQDDPWFRQDLAESQDTSAGLLEGFLDSMALFLVPPGAGSVVGCCLDLPLADQSTPIHPAPGDTALATCTNDTNTSTGEGYPDQGPPTATLRITRTSQSTASQDQQQKDLAMDIINFLQRGMRLHAQPSFNKRF